MTKTNFSPGRPVPLGAHADANGVNFAVFSAHASALTLCLFDDQGMQEIARYQLVAGSGDIWHGRVQGIGPGQVYGFRADGPWNPKQGLRFNSAKLLLDPYAKDIVGSFEWRDEHFAAERANPLQIDSRDNAMYALKARVVEATVDSEHAALPNTPLSKTVLYECHVKGFSMRNPAVPEALRGSFAGLAHPASIAYLRELGITALSLMPVHYSLREERLAKLKLRNYWGYNTIGYFCPDPRLASGATGLSAREEFRAMVNSLHEAGIEVILDVVYNHSAESDELGPNISFRGLDNPSYYWLSPHEPAAYMNFSGCGNTIKINEPRVLQMVMDSLRYWVSEMHVDGFRFDLASVLGRSENGFSRQATFFGAIAQDPVLSHVKLIAEPWDLGPGGYQLSGFPRGWLEWNDQFRDSMRRYWIESAASPEGHAPITLGELAMRLCGSSDLYQSQRRAPHSSVNFVAAHDGFTLHDLLSFNQRYNLANGERNQDGHTHNFNFNCGAEGPSTDPGVLRLRGRLKRALLACALLAQGTPMLCAGDEFGRSQNGNNNAYCQDNRDSWIDWDSLDHELLHFTRHVLQLRHRLLPFADHWYEGVADGDHPADLSWFQPDGQTMSMQRWQDPDARALSCQISQPGNTDHALMLLFNAHPSEQLFRLPPGLWQALLDTSDARGQSRWTNTNLAGYPLAAHSMALLILVK